MSDKKQSIVFREINTTYPGPNAPNTSWTQDTPTSSTRTLWPRVPPGFTEAHRGQANLYDRPLHLIPSEYSHYGAQGYCQLQGVQNYRQLDAGQIAGPITPITPVADPVTPRSDKTPTDVYSSASSYLSRHNIPPPIRTTGLNPIANDFTPGASPMSGPLSPELARDKMYLENQAEIHRRSMFRPVWVVQTRAQVIEDEREHIDAVNDWFWAQAKQAPAPKPEPKE